MPVSRKTELVANWQTLQRIFLRPENEESGAALVKYMEQILFGLHEFLKEHVGFTREASLKTLSDRFTESCIHRHPAQKLPDVIRGIIEDIAPHAVNISSPYFIGHMTSAIPFFMVHLHTIMAALNQNPVKLETSKVVSILERQTLAKIHRLIYDREDAFYKEHIQKPESTLGVFTSDGTLANLTALWVARNTLLPPITGFGGVESCGMVAACRAHGIDRVVVLVSRLGHYSLRKAGGVLGLGNENILSVDVDADSRIRIDRLRESIRDVQKEGRTKILAVVGIAGTTETGTIDPLHRIADICAENGIFFHVDAAWGGPTLASEKFRPLLAGIERADSVTIDGHKQFYMPMGCGMVYFRSPTVMDSVAYHAAYINRIGSVDLGIRSLEGSRAATSLVLSGALEIMGTGGYALLIEHGIQTARQMAEEIRNRPDFELVTPPELNILTYRIFPRDLQTAYPNADQNTKQRITEYVNHINVVVQRQQREAGKSFVSRTTLRRTGCHDMVVLRVVLMNPMTTLEILQEILNEQERIYHREISLNRPSL
jgi:glutamate decarboxylase